MNIPTKITRLLSLALALAVAAAVCPGASAADDPARSAGMEGPASSGKAEGMEKMLENGRFILNADPGTGQFNLESKSGGKTWWSTPPRADEDEYANGRTKMELYSNMIVRYVNDEVEDGYNSQIEVINTYTSSVSDGNVEVGVSGNKLKIAYKFVEYRLYIPLTVELTENGIICYVDTSEIIEGGQYRIFSISLLPYFGAAYLGEAGYLFVPDGSGALVEFDGAKSDYSQYSETVYGADYNFDIVQKAEQKQAVRMPVYGIKNGNDSFLAIIEKGSGVAEIEAAVGGGNTGYSRIYPQFNLRYASTYYLGQSVDGAIKPIVIFEKGPFDIDRVQVRMVMQTGEDAGYVGMAKAYRGHLIANDGLKALADRAPELHIEFLGATRKAKRFLGIPFTVTETLTSFFDARAVLERLKAGGADRIAVRYVGWDKNAVKGKAGDRVSVIGGLGGKSGLKKLDAYAREQGIPLYLDADFTTVADFSLLYSKNRNAVLNLSKKVVNGYQYTYIDFLKDTSAAPSYYLSPASASRMAEKYIRRYEKLGLGNISLGKTADILGSNFRQDGFTREDSAAEMARIAELAGAGGSVMLRGGNAYSLGYADRVVDAPSGSSLFDIESRSVPFYQIALYGYVKTSAAPVNFSSNPRKEFLRAIEYLSSLHYYWVACDMERLRNSDHSDLGSVDYAVWIGEAAGFAKELEAIYAKTRDSDLRSHESPAPGVAVLTWENGLSVIVNYNSEDAVVAGKTVKAENYLVAAP